MKRPILDLALALSTLALVALGLEVTYARYRTSIDHVFGDLEATLPELQVLFVGNSHLGVLGPRPLGKVPSYNLSVGGADLFHMAASVRRVLTEASELRVIVLGTDYEHSGYDLIVANERWKDRQYYPHLGVLYDDTLANRLMAHSSFFRANRDLSYLLGSRAASGPPAFRRRGNAALSPEACEARATEHSGVKYDPRLTITNLAILEEIVALARGRSVQLVCLTSPKSRCYREHFSPAVASFARQALAERCADPGAEYLDWQAHPGFFPDDYTDPDHLGPGGAARLVQEIERELGPFIRGTDPRVAASLP